MNKHTASHTLLEDALALHQRGELPQAEAIYKSILQISPQDAETWHLLGVVTHQMGNNDLALGYVRKAITLNPSALVYYNNLGEIYREMGQLGRSIKEHELQAGAAVSFQLGVDFLRREMWEAAEPALRKAIQLGPDFAAAHAELAKVLASQGKFGEAMQIYRDALSQAGEDLSQHRVVACTLETIKSYCARTGQEFLQIRAAGTFEGYLPGIFGESGSKTYPVQEPEYYIAAIQNAAVVGGHDMIVLDEDRILYDLPFQQDNERVDFTDHAVQSYWNGRVLVDLPSRMAGQLDGAVTLCGTASFNYSHWLIEYLPRLRALDDMPQYRHFPLLVDEASIQDPHQYEALQTLNRADRPVIPIRKGDIYRCKKLVVPSPLSTMPINLKEGASIKGSDVVISKLAVDYLRGHFCKPLQLDEGLPRRLYISRKSASFRRLVNEDEIQDLFERHGFVTVFPERLTFQAKLALFGGAEVVAGPASSGLTNIVFCPASTRVMLLLAEEWRSGTFLSNIAGHIGQDLDHVVGKSIPGSHKTAYHRDYVMDVGVVAKALEPLGAKAP